MKTSAKVSLIVTAAILLTVMIVFWGSVVGGLCLLALVVLIVSFIGMRIGQAGDPLDYSQSPEDEKN